MNEDNTASVLTKNAVRALINPSKPGDGTLQPVTITVSLERKHASKSDVIVPCIISDGTYKSPAFIVDANRLADKTGSESCSNTTSAVKVLGYISSDANYNKKGAGAPISFVCITSFEKIDTDPSKCSTEQQSLLDVPQPTNRIKGGQAGTVLQQILPHFSTKELSSSSCAIDSSSLVESASALALRPSVPVENVALFLANHNAMKTLSNIGQRDHNNGQHNTNNAPDNYTQCINEFRESQFQLQITSLTKNAAKHNSEGASNLVDRYSSTLKLALAHARQSSRPPLTIELLCEWHKELGSGLIPNAGKIREKGVRAGLTTFGHKDSVRGELDKLIGALKELEDRAIRGAGGRVNAEADGGSDNNSKNISTTHAGGLVLFAASALYGLNDLHPWEDGNGRLSRIASNWALARAGFPFVVNFFANANQRTEYINALETTRRNLHLVSVGNVSKDIFSMVQRFVGPLKPVVELVYDRVNKAVLECNNLISEKSRLKSEEQDAKAAKRFRDAAAAGTCLICYDDNPNIATLCCGKAVHLSCMATWLSSKLECPHCRSAFPSMLERAPRPTAPRRVVQFADANDDIDIPEESTELDTTTDNHEMADETETTTHDHEETSETIDDAPPEETETTTFHEDEEPQVEDTETEPVEEDTETTTYYEEPQVEETETEQVEEEETTTYYEEPQVEETETEPVEEDTETTTYYEDEEPQVEETEPEPIEEDTETTTYETNDDTEETHEHVEDTIDTTTTTDNASPEEASISPLRCEFCNNMAARDCDNQLCGACCQLYGTYSCSRHCT